MTSMPFTGICPETVQEWEKAAKIKDCSDPEVYHCLKDENGNRTEICLQQAWIQPEMCPEYNKKARRIDVDRCHGDPSQCPSATFWSNEVYKYPPCVQLSNIATSSDRPTNLESGESQNFTYIALGVAGGVVVLICVIGIIYFIKKRRNSRSEDRCKYNARTGTTDDIQAEKLLFNEFEKITSTSHEDYVKARNVQIYIGDDPDRLAEAYSHEIEQRCRLPCKFIRNISEWKYDQSASLYVFQDMFSTKEQLLECREILNEIYNIAQKKSATHFIFEIRKCVWDQNESTFETFSIFDKEFIHFI